MKTVKIPVKIEAYKSPKVPMNASLSTESADKIRKIHKQTKQPMAYIIGRLVEEFIDRLEVVGLDENDDNEEV